jgi:hypothetical protein
MRHGTPQETAFRAFMTVSRATVNKVNDSAMMQEMDGDSFHSHKHAKVEAPQNYGFSSNTMPRDKKEGKQGGKQGGDYAGDDKNGEAAEAIMVSAGGNNSHPVAVVIDDRRHRPRKLPEGASIQYGPNGGGEGKDKGHTASYIKPGAEGGIFILATEGRASLRFVDKPKQERPKQQANAEGQGDQQEQEEEYPHEGKTVYTEVKCTEKKVEILDGETVVAVYDRDAKSWLFKADEITAEAKNHLIVKCTDGATDIWGKPINFNGGGPTVPPFTVPG